MSATSACPPARRAETPPAPPRRKPPPPPLYPLPTHPFPRRTRCRIIVDTEVETAGSGIYGGSGSAVSHSPHPTAAPVPRATSAPAASPPNRPPPALWNIGPVTTGPMFHRAQRSLVKPAGTDPGHSISVATVR